MNDTSPRSTRLLVRLWGLLAAAGAVASVATLLGFLGRLAWFLDLFAHFRVQYLLGLTVVGLLLLVGRRWKTAGVFLALACLNLAVVLPMFFGGQAAVPSPAPALRAMLLNVNTRLGDPERVRRAVQEEDPDILVLEEISARWVRDLQWLADSHPYARVQPREDNFGIGLFSKHPLAKDAIVRIGDAGVPSILATVQTGQGTLRVIATHPLPPLGGARSRARNEQLARLPDHVDSTLPVLLLGDLNVTPWSHHFRRLLRRSGLLDSARGRGVQPTWPASNPLLRIPIDHCLHSPEVRVVERRIGADAGSDHYPVIVDFVIESGQDG